MVSTPAQKRGKGCGTALRPGEGHLKTEVERICGYRPRLEQWPLIGYFPFVSSVEHIKQAIEELPKEEFWKISEWVIQRHENEWDQQLERDIRAGKLDRLAEDALRELHEGRSHPFPE